MNAPAHDDDADFSPPTRLQVILVRATLFGALWLVLMPSIKPADIAIGLLATGIATVTSLRLLPRASGHIRFGALLRFVPHFLWQSVLAGFDVARRVFHVRMPLQPGFVTYPVDFPPGLARNEFAVITSLLPGSVPVDDSEGAIIYHSLDVSQPVVEQIEEEEELLAEVFISGETHD